MRDTYKSFTWLYNFSLKGFLLIQTPDVILISKLIYIFQLTGHTEMPVRSALPGLRLLRRCFTRRQPIGHLLVTLAFHLPNGGSGKLNLFNGCPSQILLRYP